MIKASKHQASLAMSGKRAELIVGEEDLNWLRSVHAPAMRGDVRSAVLYGSEDSPDAVECYASSEPLITDWPIEIWIAGE